MNTRNSALLVAVVLVLNGCAAPRQGGPGGQTTEQPGGTSSAQACNPVVIGAAAALTCGLLAKGNNRARAAAVCAAAAVTACYLANSYKAEQVRSAKQVEEEYMKRHRQLPEKTVVTAYRSEVSPRGAVSKGQLVSVISNIIAVQGRSDRVVLIEEEIAVVDGAGDSWGKITRKTANSGNQAGEFKTSFSIPVDDKWSQGVYTVQRTLYVNGAVVQRDDSSTRFQIVRGPVDQSYALVAVAD